MRNLLLLFALTIAASCGSQHMEPNLDRDFASEINGIEASQGEIYASEFVTPSIERMVAFGNEKYCHSMGATDDECYVMCEEIDNGIGILCAIGGNDFDAEIVCIEDRSGALHCEENHLNIDREEPVSLESLNLRAMDFCMRNSETGHDCDYHCSSEIGFGSCQIWHEDWVAMLECDRDSSGVVCESWFECQLENDDDYCGC